MKKLSEALTIIVFALSARIALADQITMKDGDRITGDIVKKDGDTVTVKSKNFGTVTLKWSDVAQVKTEQPLNVVLPGNRTVKANIETQDGRIQVAAPGAPQTVAPNDVVALRNDDEQKSYERFLHPGWLDLWTVTGSLGIAGTKGNAETSTLTTPFNFVRASHTTRITAYFNSIRSTATVNGVNAQTAKAIRGGWAYNRNFDATKVFFNAFNDYEYDKFQNLDLRVVLGGGIGYQIWSGDGNRLSVVGGGAWNRAAFSETASTAAFTRKSGEAYWGNDLNYKMNSRTTLVQSFRMFNDLSNTGEYRMNFDAGATTALTKWLNWTISLSDRYLSDAVPGRKNNDFLYSTSFGFSWARQ
jgi:putative salt-induced outer membrane protein